MNEAYKSQVKLLLTVLPEVAKETCFAMHGGTAINLFVREMPRLSVDIDLTYVELEDRQASLDNINAALSRIKKRVESLVPTIQVVHKELLCKLQVAEKGAIIKLEVNMVGRGLLHESSRLPLCKTAQEVFDSYCVVPVVSLGQLYGGKLCAALDRQHPRDLFDVRLLLENEGFNKEIKEGLIYGLACSNRPTHELITPNTLDQQNVFSNQFDGMSILEFSYKDFEDTRAELIEIVGSQLTDDDKVFLLSLNRLQPDWSIYNFQDYPSLKWKLLNLEKLREKNEVKYQQQLGELEKMLSR